MHVSALTTVRYAVIIMTSLEAQNKFGTAMDTSQREPVVITRRGRAANFMMSANAEPRELQYQFTKLMSELFPLEDKAGAEALNQILAPVRARTAAEGLTEEKLYALLNEK